MLFTRATSTLFLFTAPVISLRLTPIQEHTARILVVGSKIQHLIDRHLLGNVDLASPPKAKENFAVFGGAMLHKQPLLLRIAVVTPTGGTAWLYNFLAERGLVMSFEHSEPY
ncbi:MAG: hypothetical protein K7J46_03510 [Bryobacter sp.]|nr:hypothetical protein [Bryobacter sp. CoA8 C33]